jgi:hypothetical protein
MAAKIKNTIASKILAKYVGKNNPRKSKAANAIKYNPSKLKKMKSTIGKIFLIIPASNFFIKNLKITDVIPFNIPMFNIFI